MFQAVNLRCEYQKSPMGLDDAQPRFSWQLQDTQSVQAAYRIQVFYENQEKPFWDSGKVSSRASHLIRYEGQALKPRSRYCWRVRVWDKKGRDSDFSEKAWWETGLMPEGKLSGRFIGAPDDGGEILQPATRLRKEFEVRGEIERARLYITSLGIYQAAINGRDVTDRVLCPGWTSYNHRMQYQTYDVTELLSRGENVLGVTLGDGWYRSALSLRKHPGQYGHHPAVWAQLHVRLKNGSEMVYVTDASWKTDRRGPIRYADYYDGTHYDARLEDDSWKKSGYNVSGWLDATELPTPSAKLVAQRDQGVRRIQTVSAKQIIHTPKGETVIDFGQNMVGWVRFSVDGEAGHRVTIRHAEVLDKDGNFYTDNYRDAKALIEYTLKEGGKQRFEPQLTFYGFRYIQLIDWPCEVKLSDFEGVVVHTDIPFTSGFECSDERVNQLFRNIQWGQRGNFVDVPTDCPQRDERLGWTGDCQVFARTACTNMDSALMLTEWLKDLACDQRQDGAVPFIVPQVLGETAYGSAAWGDAAVIVPWVIYQCYGDEKVLRDQYPSMRAWLRYYESLSTDGICDSGFHFGDWLGLDAPSGSYTGSTDKTLIATAFAAHSTYLTMRTAEILGYEKDVSELRQAHKNILRAFRREFITPNGRLAVRTQTAYALTLHFDLVEEQHRARMAAEFANLVRESGNHLTTGFVGTPYLCKTLSECGYHDLAAQVFLQSDYPGWLYPISRGATTMWEHWDGIRPDGGFWSRDMNSYNHYAYGAIGEWMIRALAGIDMTQPGYGELLLHPRPVEGLNFVSGWVMTPAGKAQCEWRIEDDLHTVSCQVPVGVRAILILEHADIHQVTESEKLLSEVGGVTRSWQSEDDVMLEVRSGKYTFKWRTQTLAN